jgi:hypothetical protein
MGILRQSAEESELWRELPHGAATPGAVQAILAARAAIIGRAIEIALAVQHCAAEWPSPVAAAGKVVQVGVNPAVTGGRQLENGAATVEATLISLKRGCAVEIAGAVHRQAADISCALGSRRKGVQQGVRPASAGGRKLVHGSGIIGLGNPAGRAVEISGSIHEQVS